MAQLGPTDQGVHPGNQLGEIERLREVVVRAAFEAGRPRLELVLRREHQHGRVYAALPQLCDHAESVPAGEHDVEDDAVVGVVERALEGAVTGFCFGDAVALLAEGLAQEAPQVAVVLNDEYLHAPNLRPAASRGQCAPARIRSPRATRPTLPGCPASRATQRGALAGAPRSTDENSMRTLSYRPRGDPRRGPEALFPRQEGISSYLTRDAASPEDADRCSRARGRSRRRLLSGPWGHRLHRPRRPPRRPARRDSAPSQRWAGPG